jgi:hypothetical protein
MPLGRVGYNILTAKANRNKQCKLRAEWYYWLRDSPEEVHRATQH